MMRESGPLRQKFDKAEYDFYFFPFGSLFSAGLARRDGFYFHFFSPCLAFPAPRPWYAQHGIPDILLICIVA